MARNPNHPSDPRDVAHRAEASTTPDQVPTNNATQRHAPAGSNESMSHQDDTQNTSVPVGNQVEEAPSLTPAEPVRRSRKKLIAYGIGAVLLVLALFHAIPFAYTAMVTISTDDAYIDGHYTLAAPRVAGQVKRVLVDDNYRVKKGDLLVELDKEPYLVQVSIRKAAVETAVADLAAAKAQARGLAAHARSNRFLLEHTIEDVHTQIANLRAYVATLASHEATLALAKANLVRGEELAPRGGISKEDLDQRRQEYQVQQAKLEQAQETVAAMRVGLGLPAKPPAGQSLADVPPHLDQTYSGVRQAAGELLQTTTELGYTPTSWDETPAAVVDNFLKQDPAEDIDRVLARYVENAPAVKQAEAKLQQAKRDLAQAELDLKYCDIVSDIDGVVTRRNVNPGDYIQVGQSLMAVRSLTQIWVNANFKETQLADLRIGQRVRCEVDMYGQRHEYEGRITGFTMGTGQTLALLPPQNATGNFVKVVQRLPVRIELTDYSPDKDPLFVGLSVVPYVYYKETATGPNAGQVIQPLRPLPNTNPYPGADFSHSQQAMVSQ